MIRISGGYARGIQLQVPPHARPATEQMREALFSSLGQQIEGAVFLDLFAGSGSYGLEAISRGARRGVFVDRNPQSCQAIQNNLEAVLKSLHQYGTRTNETIAPENHRPTVPIKSDFRIVCKNALAELPHLPEAYFDFIFADAPYEQAAHLYPELIRHTRMLISSRPGAQLLLEIPGDALLPHFPGWRLRKRLGHQRSAKKPTLLCYEPAL